MFGFRDRLFGQGKTPPRSEEVDYNQIHSIETDVDMAQITDINGNEEYLYDVIKVDISTLKAQDLGGKRTNEINVEYDVVDRTFRVYFNIPVKASISKSRSGNTITVKS